MIKYDYITAAVHVRSDHNLNDLADEAQLQMDDAGKIGYRHVSTTLVGTTLLIVMERATD